MTMIATQRQPTDGVRRGRPGGLGCSGLPRPSGDGLTFQPRGSRSISATLEPVALLLPRVCVVVVAVELPEPLSVLGQDLEAAQELRRLPEVALGHEEAQRGAVIGLERLAPVGGGGGAGAVGGGPAPAG